jgi:hypothetical protein
MRMKTIFTDFTKAIRKVTAKHIRKALAEIDRDGVPRNRRSKKWCLRFKRTLYPPKYVLSLAVKHATGRALPTNEHPGGEDTNRYLRWALQSERGFAIFRCRTGSNTAVF